jgi:hypothetical protein
MWWSVRNSAMPAARFKTSRTEFRLVDGAYISTTPEMKPFSTKPQRLVGNWPTEEQSRNINSTLLR